MRVISSFLSLFNSAPAGAALDARAPGPGAVQVEVASQEYLDAHVETIQRILNVLLPEDQRLVRQPLETCAQLVADLPNPADYYIERGGLLRLSIDVAFTALSIADGVLLSGADTPVEVRRTLEPAYRYAAFLAGCFSFVQHSVSFTVIAGEHTWRFPDEPVGDFLKRYPHAIVSRNGRAMGRDVAVWMAARCIPDIAAQHLSTQDPSLVATWLAAIAPERGDSPLSTAVHHAIGQVVARDRAKRAEIAVPQKPKSDADRPGTLAVPKIEGGTGETKPATAVPNGDVNALFAQLGEEAAMVMQALVQDAKQPERRRRITFTAEGAVIPIDLIASYGVPTGSVMAGLQKGGWIVRRERSAIVVTPEIATKLFAKS